MRTDVHETKRQTVLLQILIHGVSSRMAMSHSPSLVPAGSVKEDCHCTRVQLDRIRYLERVATYTH